MTDLSAIAEIANGSLLSPPVLFFLIGLFAGLVKSDLAIPDAIGKALAIYLMAAIGFKGGAALAITGDGQAAALTIGAGLLISFLLPFVAFGCLSATTRLDVSTRAAAAAHYGSISVVTYAAASSFLQKHNIPADGYMAAVVAVMETPAIISALLIARYALRQNGQPDAATAGQRGVQLPRPPLLDGRMLHEAFANGTIVLLTGAFLAGWATGSEGLVQVKPFFVDPFHGILTLFLLDMGLAVSRQLHHLRRFTLPLAAFGFYMPLIGAAVGLGAAMLLDLRPGSGALFMTLCASASYIAVPAAMRMVLPEASPAIYLPLSLALTFPFNLTVGIPLYVVIAGHMLGG